MVRDAEGTEIDGVRLLPLHPHHDERGTFTEVFAAHWGAGIDPAQWSVVHSAPGVLRGMHLHLRHDELVTVVAGVLWVGLHDLRPGSATSGAASLIRLDGQRPTTLSFPRGIVHGWLAETPVVHLQAVSEAYDRYGADDNEGCRWDDPGLGIAWPAPPTAVSPRAAAFGSLSDLRADVERRLGAAATDGLVAGAP
jgi:dTDP-4-dehydrorhamnose 3,5-epimerase